MNRDAGRSQSNDNVWWEEHFLFHQPILHEPSNPHLHRPSSIFFINHLQSCSHTHRLISPIPQRPPSKHRVSVKSTSVLRSPVHWTDFFSQSVDLVVLRRVQLALCIQHVSVPGRAPSTTASWHLQSHIAHQACTTCNSRPKRQHNHERTLGGCQ
jgi:hypothetical protein